MIQIAWGMLILWPFLSMVFFRAFSLPVAVSLTMVGGYLLLPTGISFDLPALPPINKSTIPAFTALLLTIFIARRSKPVGMLDGWLPKSRLALTLIGLLILGALGTVLTNGDRLSFGPRVQPALGFYDFFSFGLGHIVMLLPFFLARKVLATPQAQLTFLKVLVIGALGYSLLALWEVRMSPQLNRQVYGFFPHEWLQHIRDGGFRPVVFLQHGLLLGVFLACAIVAAVGIGRIRGETHPARWFFAALWLFGTMVLSKVFGALLITCALVPIALQHARVQLIAAAAIAVMVMTYPMLRALDVLPVDRVVAMASQIDTGRAGSLQYRLNNEDILLERARERQVFGWGGWGRNRVFDQFGRDLSTTDGTWIITFGQGGWIRYLAEFGLLAGGVILMAFSRRRIDPVFGVTAIVLAANLIDLLPNSGSSPLTWMLAGSIFGCLERRRHVSVPEMQIPQGRQYPTHQRTFPATATACSGDPAPALGTAPVLRRDFGSRGPNPGRQD